MAKGRFNIKGTKDFLVAAVFCGFLCVWAIRDAWFPTQKILKKYPLEVPVAFSISGVVKEVPVRAGQEFAGKRVLATLHDDLYRRRVEEAEALFEAARADRSPDTEVRLADLMQARADLEACTIYNTDIMLHGSHGDEPLRGVVLKITAPPATAVEAGAPVLTVKPHNTFYIFNKTLAVLSLIGMVAALIFHGIASR
jgi:multidrug resistance efflux pump